MAIARVRAVLGVDRAKIGEVITRAEAMYAGMNANRPKPPVAEGAGADAHLCGEDDSRGTAGLADKRVRLERYLTYPPEEQDDEES